MSFEQAVVQLEQTNSALQEEVVRFRDAAMGLNAIYPTITEGRQAVADGKYFSVPGGGAYMRLYRRQGTSAELIAEFPDRAQVQGIVDVFAGRGVTGPGDLMARGAGGLLSESSATVSDLNGNRENGFYSTTATTLGRPDTGIGPVLQMNRAGVRKGFIALTDAAGGRMYFNAEGGSGFGPLKEVYHTGNLLGTVSLSDGVPTGAIMEWDSNSDGEWIVFANNVMFCRRAVTVNLNAGQVVGFSTPQSFVGTSSDVSAALSWVSSSFGGPQRRDTLIEVTGSKGWALRNIGNSNYSGDATALLTMWGKRAA